MQRDDKDTYLLPEELCPGSCAECRFYDARQKLAYCIANGFKTATFAWKTPRGSILSHVPPCCPWWYIEVVGTPEERRWRLWWLVGQTATAKMDKARKMEYLRHISRVGGIEKVDRKEYPEIAEALKEVRERMGI